MEIYYNLNITGPLSIFISRVNERAWLNSIPMVTEILYVILLTRLDHFCKFIGATIPVVL